MKLVALLETIIEAAGITLITSGERERISVSI